MYAGDLEGAVRTAEEGIRVRETLAAAEPANAGVRRDLMNIYQEMAYLFFHPSYLSYGDGRAAAVFHQKALVIARELAAADSSNATAQFDLAGAEAETCAALNQNDPAQAIGHCRDALAIAARWPRLLSTDAMLPYLADALHKLGRDSEALDALRSAIETSKAVIQHDPSRFNVRQQLVRSYNQMGGLLLDMGDAAGASDRFREALALAGELASAIPSNLLSRRDLADTYDSLGRYYEGRDWSQARAWHQKSLDIWTAWPQFTVSSRMDVDRRGKAERAVARCEAAARSTK
jgi:tetratricopeptide (TPR) repeat protein